MEMIVLVDRDGHEIGTAPKLASHHAQTPLHRAFSCYVFRRDAKLLVTRRALVKKVWPGVWTNSFCGHPGPGEDTPDAIVRRAQFELGLTVSSIQNILPTYTYKTPPFNGIIEHEFCPVYVAMAESREVPNPAEVGESEWMSWSEYSQALVSRSSEFSYWAKDQHAALLKSSLFNDFINQLH